MPTRWPAQDEHEARRREWEARPPDERIAGRLTFWIQGRRRKRQEPTPAEVEAKRVELLTELAAPFGIGTLGPQEPQA